MSIFEGPLGRNTPPDFEHVEKYPMTSEHLLLPPQPVAVGFHWYEDFDRPYQIDGSWHLPEAKNIKGQIRGGHCFCLEPMGAVIENIRAWWKFFNQGVEGACEGFGHSRMMSIHRRVTYDAFWLYDQARKIEGTYPNGEGATNRGACEALQSIGLRTQSGEVTSRTGDVNGPVRASLGISSYHWATQVSDILTALGRPGASAVPFQNSWGEGYPEVVWMPVSTVARLLAEEGEASIVIPR